MPFRHDKPYADVSFEVWDSVSFLNSLQPTQVPKLPRDDQTCSICLGDFIASHTEESNLPVKLPCGHVFGRCCITNWLTPFGPSQPCSPPAVLPRDLHNSCPECRNKPFPAVYIPDSLTDLEYRLRLWDVVYHLLAIQRSDFEDESRRVLWEFLAIRRAMHSQLETSEPEWREKQRHDFTAKARKRFGDFAKWILDNGRYDAFNQHDQSRLSWMRYIADHEGTWYDLSSENPTRLWEDYDQPSTETSFLDGQYPHPKAYIDELLALNHRWGPDWDEYEDGSGEAADRMRELNSDARDQPDITTEADGDVMMTDAEPLTQTPNNQVVDSQDFHALFSEGYSQGPRPLISYGHSPGSRILASLAAKALRFPANSQTQPDPSSV